MRSFNLRPGIIAVPVLLGLAMAGAAFANGDTTDNAAICGINAKHHGNMVTLEAAFHSSVAAIGSYQLNIKSSGVGGNSHISQGGPFAAIANDVVTLGQVSVNSNSTFAVEFTVIANGVALDCSTDIATRL